MKSNIHLTTLDTGSIEEDIQEKKALPELILKANILKSEEAVLLLENELMNYYRRTKRINNYVKWKFEGSLILLWSYIKKMIEEKGIQKEDEIYIEYLDKLELGFSFKLPALMRVKNFILKSLHRLGITNLLMKTKGSFETEIKNEYN